MADTFEVFNGVSGFSGFYSPNTDGIDTAIRFVRGNKEQAEAAGSSGSYETLDDGFLAQSFTVEWGRGVTMQRVLNKNKPIAMVGVGAGTLSITGLLGTYKGFKSILGLDDSSTTEDLCNPLNAIIACSNGFNICDENGGSSKATENVNLILTNIIVAGFNITGQYDQNNILMQTGNVRFQIGGCKIQARTK